MKETTEKNCKQKTLTVVYMIIAVLAAVFAVLDFAELWQYAHIAWTFSFAVLCAIDCAQNWKERRKTAITELVIGVALLGLGIAGFFI